MSAIFSLRRDAYFADPGVLQSIHQGDQLLHRQFAIRPDHNRDIRIGAPQFGKPLRKTLWIYGFIVQLDRFIAIDRHGLDAMWVDRVVIGVARRDYEVCAVFQ